MSKNTSSNEGDLHAQRQKESLQRQEKLQGLAQDLKQAKIPSTGVIADSIDRTVESTTLQETTTTMSPAGQKAVEDMKKTLIAGKEVLLEKNQDDQLQRAIYQGSKVMGGATALKGQDLASKYFSGTSQLASQAAQRIVDLGRLLVSSSEFRNLIRDFRDLIEDALSASLSAVSPDDNNMADDMGRTAKEEPLDLPSTARERAPEIYHQAHQTVEPVVIRYSKGETSMSEAARELGSKAAETTRIAGQAARENLVSPERRDQFVERLRSIIMEVQSHPDFQNGINELLDLIKEVAARSTVFIEAAADTTATEADKHAEELAEARQATRELVENFCGGRSIEPLKLAVKKFADDIAEDEVLMAYIDEANTFIHRAIREPGFVASDRFSADGQDLYSRGRDAFKENYMDDLNAIWREIKELLEGAARDRTINEFTANLSELMSDLFLDENGQPTLKFDIIRDFARLLPLIAEKLEYIPVPRMEGSDPEVDYSLDNVVLRCSNLVPRELRFRTDTTIHMEPPVPYSDRVQSRRRRGDFNITNRVYISLTNIRADSRDIAFYFKKKTGMVQLSDYGTLDIIIPDKGLSIYLTLITSEEETELRDHAFKIEKAEAEVHNLKLNMRAKKHDILFKLLNPIITRQAKRAVEGALSERLQSLLNNIDEQLVVIGRRTVEAGAKAQSKISSTAKGVVSRNQKHDDVGVRVEEISVEREP